MRSLLKETVSHFVAQTDQQTPEIMETHCPSETEQQPITVESCSELLSFIDRDDWPSCVQAGKEIRQILGDKGYQPWVEWLKNSPRWNEIAEAELRKCWEDLKPDGNGLGKSTTTMATDCLLQQEGEHCIEKNVVQPDEKWKNETNPKDPDSLKVVSDGFHYTTNKKGENCLITNLHNISKILADDKSPIWLDLFLQKIQSTLFSTDGKAREWTDHNTLELQRRLQSQRGLSRLSKQMAGDAVTLHAGKNTRNCLTEWLEGLKWDGSKRLDSWLIKFCGAEDNEYVREVGRCWLLGAIARAYQAGIKVDHCLIFEGEQGIGKSRLLQTLSNGFCVELNQFDGKGAAELLPGAWIVEISELDGMKKAEVESIKRFLTTQSDRYRPAYGRYTVDVPRSCVFAGTTNENAYLRDPTGNRRFWPVKCAWIRFSDEDRNQLLAEAVHRYKQGESFLIKDEVQDLATKEQEARYIGDVWEATISEYISGKTEVTMEQLFQEALQIVVVGQLQKTHQIRIGKIMRSLGWERVRYQREGLRGYSYTKKYD